jgi:hypothetical protein
MDFEVMRQHFSLYAQFSIIIIYVINETYIFCDFQAPWVALGRTVQALIWWITIGNKLVGVKVILM